MTANGAGVWSCPSFRHIGLGAVMVIGLSASAEAGQTIADAQHVVTPKVMAERAYRVRTAVRAAVRDAFDPGGQSVIAITATHGGNSMSTADVVDPASPRWDLWASASYTDLDDDHPISSFEGSTYSAVFGIDYQITERFLFGVLGNVNRSEIDTSFFTLTGRSESDQVAVGVYIGVVLADFLVADLAYLYNWGDNFLADSTDFSRFDSDGWSLTGNLTGYWFTGDWRWSPSAGIALSENRDDAYVDVPGGFAVPSQKQKTGVFNFGGQAGRTVSFGDMSSAEFWAGVQGEWTFEQDTGTAVIPTAPVRDDDFDVRLSGGVDVSVNPNFSISLSGDVAGLAIDDYLTIGISARASVLF